MRPVIRGEIPTDENGNAVKYSDYKEARPELINRLGEYCSYCEMHLDASLAVEHVQPKKPRRSENVDLQRSLDWNNFLLACTNCNSTKSNRESEIHDCIWPDQDNSFRALEYSEGGLVSPAENLPQDILGKVNNLINLVGLDVIPGSQSERTGSDRRWNNRREAWDIAQRSKDRLSINNTEHMKEQIIDTARTNGYWSIWMTVFHDNCDMLRRLIESFPGTCMECFDSNNNYLPIRRVGGQY